jgi:prepilin peptidase CpaA
VPILQLAVHHIVILSFVGLLVWAAVNDSRHFIIPNKLCAAIVGLYPAHVMASPVPVPWDISLVLAVVVFVVFAVFFSMSFMGGGDVKLVTATALWAGPQYLLLLLLTTAFIGGVFALGMLIHLRLFAPSPAGDGAPRSWREKLFVGVRTRVPYGVAIAVGGVFVAVRLFSA